jgi:hypothetical protein
MDKPELGSPIILPAFSVTQATGNKDNGYEKEGANYPVIFEMIIKFYAIFYSLKIIPAAFFPCAADVVSKVAVFRYENKKCFPLNL